MSSSVLHLFVGEDAFSLLRLLLILQLSRDHEVRRCQRVTGWNSIWCVRSSVTVYNAVLPLSLSTPPRSPHSKNSPVNVGTHVKNLSQVQSKQHNSKVPKMNAVVLSLTFALASLKVIQTRRTLLKCNKASCNLSKLNTILLHARALGQC